MKALDFIDQLDKQNIVDAIRQAEAKTCAEIRVFISRKEPEDVLESAKQRFLKLGMDKTVERNGVLIYVAPRVQQFAVVGDTAIHARCGEAFWKKLTDEMSRHFRERRFTDGLLHGIQKAGELLAEHFPIQPGDKNELSDEVAHD